jgi:hypothetical protein
MGLYGLIPFVAFFFTYTHISLTHDLSRSSRYISDIPSRHLFYQNDLDTTNIADVIVVSLLAAFYDIY